MPSFRSLLLAITGVTAVAAQNYTLEGPFNLVIKSNNATLNNTALGACHEGAAIEGLCLYNKITELNSSESVFGLNVSDSAFQNYTLGVTGLLVYNLNFTGPNDTPSSVSSPMKFVPNEASNVAHLQFQPSLTGTTVAFDPMDILNVQSYIDDSVVPAVTNVTVAYYRFYACHTYSQGYQYETINWVYGNGKPQNPSCQHVQVMRINGTMT